VVQLLLESETCSLVDPGVNARNEAGAPSVTGAVPATVPVVLVDVSGSVIVTVTVSPGVSVPEMTGSGSRATPRRPGT